MEKTRQEGSIFQSLFDYSGALLVSGHCRPTMSGYGNIDQLQHKAMSSTG